jgi:phosphate transport system substrate-binding protein
MQRRFGWASRAGLVAVTGVLAAAAWTTTGLAGLDALSGRITADGSSTVGPFTTAAAEMFQRKHRSVQITVGISGTGGGFERFCRDEIDLANASRPIRASEHQSCLGNGVRWLAMTVANDGIALVVNRSNTWASCLTAAELRKIWDSGSRVDNWRDVRAGFPDVPLKLFGAGTDSGTFDFFTEAINGRARRSRSDYTASENDNVLVTGVAGERGALGYFGLSYYQENRSRLKLLAVDGGNGCVTPNIATVQSKRYKPLSRPLFIYAKRASFGRAEIRAFLGFVLNNQRAIATRVRFVPLTDRQARGQRVRYAHALRSVR